MRGGLGVFYDVNLLKHTILERHVFLPVGITNENLNLMLQPARDTVVTGIEVPKGTILMCLMRAGPTNERRFPDARSFDPERWLEGAMRGASASSPKRVAMPFGAGPRLCPGRYLAMLEMRMVMAMLLAGFHIERVSTPDGREAQEYLAFTMYPVGLRLKLGEKAQA